MLKNISYRLSLIFRSYFKKQTTIDPLKEFEDYASQLERQMNNISVSLAGFKAKESVIVSELQAARKKIELVGGKINSGASENAAENAQLLQLQKQYKTDAQELELKLDQIQKRLGQTQMTYKMLNAEISRLLDKGEELKSRYRTAEAQQLLYGDSSGVTSADGISRIDHLIHKVKHMEAQAESYFELSPLEMRIDKGNFS